MRKPSLSTSGGIASIAGGLVSANRSCSVSLYSRFESRLSTLGAVSGAADAHAAWVPGPFPTPVVPTLPVPPVPLATALPAPPTPVSGPLPALPTPPTALPTLPVQAAAHTTPVKSASIEIFDVPVRMAQTSGRGG